jgi:hypothetical protein
MYQYEVGGYLYGQPRTIKDCCILNYDPSGPTLVIAMTGMTSKEAKKIRQGKIEFKLFEREGILFLLTQIPGAMDWSDAPFHIGLYSDGRTVPEEIPDGGGWGLTVIGIEARDSIIKALRFIGLGTDFSRKMIDIIKRQQGRRVSAVEHHNKLNQIYREYDCEKMARRSIAYYKAEGRENG